MIWMEAEVETLRDIPPQEGGVLLIGINPSPVSVAAGHYYQGTLGKRLWGRMRRVGLLADDSHWEDEAFTGVGHGLTDIVKRPTTGEAALMRGEIEFGTGLLRKNVAAWKPSLVLFAFKAPADALLGGSADPGEGPPFEGIPTFRLSPPYARREDVAENERLLVRVLKRGVLGKDG